MRFTYSRAQRYGSNAKMLGRAHVCRSKGNFVGAIIRLVLVKMSLSDYDSMFEMWWGTF